MKFVARQLKLSAVQAAGLPGGVRALPQHVRPPTLLTEEDLVSAQQGPLRGGHTGGHEEDIQGDMRGTYRGT